LWTELAFDIDPDQIDPECGNGSIYWICTSNDHCGKGMVKKCVNCGESTRSIDFIDPKCLSATGKEATKLIQALINELGISREDIRVYFSGNKGFHLYVSSDVLRELDQNGRKEIVDYLALEGLKEELFIVKWAGKRYIVNEGLGNRIIQNAMEIIEQRRSYPNIFTKEVMGKVDQAREKLRVELGKGSLDLIFSIFGGRKARRFLALAMEKSKVKVDPAVTLDLHRLFRMPGTLNSKSHLPKFPAELKMLGDNILDGMPEYGLNSVNIHVRIAPEIHMNGMNFGPFDNERAEVPAYLASYLITKGVATIV